MSTTIVERSLSENLTARVVGIDLVADHAMNDDRGRKIGGVAYIRPLGSLFAVRIQATRDGREFGATRRRVTVTSYDIAVNLATHKLNDQGKRFRKGYR